MLVCEQQLKDTVNDLCRSPRPAESRRLEECRTACEARLTEWGWSVQRMPFESDDASGTLIRGVNLVARYGTAPREPASPVFVLGAHLDSCEDTPGADDNASAVAALMEVARLLPAHLPQSVSHTSPVIPELVLFDLEENGMLGGAFHAEFCRSERRNLIGMISLEMLGYCDSRPGTQQLPPELTGQYPTIGNFIAVVGDDRSGPLVQHFGRHLAAVRGLPVEQALIPMQGRAVPATRLSDHSPFWDAGFPAAMITDTSFLRNPHYHRPTDTPETLDYHFLRKVTEGVLTAMSELSRLSAPKS